MQKNKQINARHFAYSRMKREVEGCKIFILWYNSIILQSWVYFRRKVGEKNAERV